MSIATGEPKTNLELVTELMEFSPAGALAQVFIIDAIYKHATTVAQLDPTVMAPNPFVSNEAWVKAAGHIKTTIDAFYGGFGR